MRKLTQLDPVVKPSPFHGVLLEGLEVCPREERASLVHDHIEVAVADSTRESATVCLIRNNMRVDALESEDAQSVAAPPVENHLGVEVHMDVNVVRL